MKRSTTKVLMVLTSLTLVSASTTVSCVGSKKPSKEQTSTLEKYIKTEAPSDITKLDINFDNKITLLGYKIASQSAVKPGERVKFTLYWKVEKALDASGWRLFTHILNEKNKKLLNIDNVGPLRDNGKQAGQLHPPSEWEAGKIYVDEQNFRVPKKASGRDINIVTGIWKGKERLKIQSGPSNGQDRAVVTTLKVSGTRPSPKVNKAVPELRVDKLEKGQTIKIDGKLDDKAWETAASTGAFVNVATGDADKKASVQGSARILWDDKHLYLGFEVADKDVVGGFKEDEQDPHLWTKDCVEIMIDPDGDGDNKDYYEIQVNPQNLVFDSQFDDYNAPKGGENGPFGHQDWSAKLKSAVVVDGSLDKAGDEDKGYTVEIQIPWASFGKAKQTPPELGQKWRMNLYAMQNNGGVSWSPILKQGNFHKAPRFGRILWASKDWVDPAKATDVAPVSDQKPATAEVKPSAKPAEPSAKPAKPAPQPQAPSAPAPKAAPAPKTAPTAKPAVPSGP